MNVCIHTFIECLDFTFIDLVSQNFDNNYVINHEITNYFEKGCRVNFDKVNLLSYDIFNKNSLVVFP